jgi:hypothetical protein
MGQTEVVLDAAAFLDAPQVKELEAETKDVRRVIEAFLTICYHDLGKKPRFLDGHDMHQALGHLLPDRLQPKDAVAKHVPAILGAYIDHLETTEVMTEAFEVRQSLQATTGEFLETVRTGKNVHHHHGPPPQDPFVHGAAKLGRNDPCSCGSGKKFKKCHGKNA